MSLPSELEIRACEAIVSIANAGAIDELREEIAAVQREFRSDKDRAWRSSNPIGFVAQSGKLLSNLSGLPVEQCKAAMVAATEDDWATMCLEAIVAFADQIEANRVEESTT